MKTLIALVAVFFLSLFGVASAEKSSKPKEVHDHGHEEHEGHDESAHKPKAEEHKESEHAHEDGHEEGEEHAHEGEKGDDHDHGKEEGKDGHAGHDEDEHGHEEGGSRVGPDKGILAATEQDGIKLSPEAIKNFELKSKVLVGSGPWTIPSTARLLAGEEVNLFRMRDGFYKRIDFTLHRRNAEELIVSSKELKTGDSIITNGIGFLRIAEITAFGGAPEGHSH